MESFNYTNEILEDFILQMHPKEHVEQLEEQAKREQKENDKAKRVVQDVKRKNLNELKK
ncbi:hypothetical protein EV207_103175 [Scopulibacillus darangshiensis]|uniref:Uncharacterized protein n=1 Tax=Scopulibacillus darangshiensis TaxID=442528 RepID=A0A4R2PB05_9BACL|nr:hypothetical protein [Scopulibacillus darangshiensis]TCP31291.1 hypothetical protein EV207_103175 [Scopulibacillus darangshiensis]